VGLSAVERAHLPPTAWSRIAARLVYGRFCCTIILWAKITSASLKIWDEPDPVVGAPVPVCWPPQAASVRVTTPVKNAPTRTANLAYVVIANPRSRLSNNPCADAPRRQSGSDTVWKGGGNQRPILTRTDSTGA
jgi:hypothetical protein